MNTKKEYIAPKLTAVSIKVERGYADSSWLGFNSFGVDPLLDGYDASNQEVWAWNGESSNQFGGDDWGSGWSSD